MILDYIALENFGVYGGLQEATLTTDPEKPIVLFGGMNGGGKTTLLDAIQLAFYGSKARISNRGKMNYKDYLRQSIHQGVDPSEGARIKIHFRRIVQGEVKSFEIQRDWREGAKGIEEKVNVWCDGKFDQIFADHWEEVIDSYLPSSIAHLFFFDGEQIKELAEGTHVAEILGTAVNSLLGLDLVDRLESDLKVFERRKKTETLDNDALEKLSKIQQEIAIIDSKQETIANTEGALINEAGRLSKKIREKEEEFRREGGEFFQKKEETQKKLSEIRNHKSKLEANFRELIAGPLPLQMIRHLLNDLQRQVFKENEIRRAKAMLDALAERDQKILDFLEAESLTKDSIKKVDLLLTKDRKKRTDLAKQPLLLEAEEGLAVKISHLQNEILPSAHQTAEAYIRLIELQEEGIFRLETDLGRIPPADRIAELQNELNKITNSHKSKLVEIEQIAIKKQALQRERISAEKNYEKMSAQNMETRFSEDDRQRILKHSRRVRETLDNFRIKVIQRHTEKIEALMLESFCKLLRKSRLITGLSIKPKTFKTTLLGKDGYELPIDRLSAGERQLLSTSMLWGLARASGRPVPMVIDTPLGRLDSSHRRHLVERYFPSASHQVILLSTDEEIVGQAYEALKPFITRTYLLTHSEENSTTSIEHGYFPQYETAS